MEATGEDRKREQGGPPVDAKELQRKFLRF